MSVYAAERPELLDRALRSVLAGQTVRPAQLVLVEDGPLTEGLYGVIGRYRASFPGFVSLPLARNGGLGRALDAGLQACTHEWVARMDSDDISHPERFERQLRYLEAHPELDVLGCALSEFEVDPAVVRSVRACPAGVGEYIKFRSPLNHATVFFRRSSVLGAGGYVHCPYMEDYHLWIRMHAMGMRLSSMPDVLYLCKMDAGAVGRRGGMRYVRSEARIQRLLLRTGIISLPRYCVNMAVRCGGRVIPGGMRAFVYRNFLRKKAGR